MTAMKRRNRLFRQVLRAYMVRIGGTIISENERHSKFLYKDIEVLIPVYNIKAFTVFVGEDTMVSESYSVEKAFNRFKNFLESKC